MAAQVRSREPGGTGAGATGRASPLAAGRRGRGPERVGRRQVGRGRRRRCGLGGQSPSLGQGLGRGGSKVPDLPGRATRPPPTRARRPRLCKMDGSCWAHVGSARSPQIPWKSPHPAGRAGGLPWGHAGLGSWPGPIMTANGSSGCVRHEKVGHTLGKRSVRHRRGTTSAIWSLGPDSWLCHSFFCPAIWGRVIQALKPSEKRAPSGHPLVSQIMRGKPLTYEVGELVSRDPRSTLLFSSLWPLLLCIWFSSAGPELRSEQSSAPPSW